MQKRARGGLRRSKASARVQVAVLGCFLFASSMVDAGGPSCGMIVGPGQTLILTGPLGPCDDDAGPAAIIVDSGTLDLAGFDITCSDTGAVNDALPDGILLVGSKAEVRGGIVQGCGVGCM